jgi:hypothetical protein
MRGRGGVAQNGDLMRIRLATSLTAAAVLMLSLATTARPADAAVITFEFTGTYDTLSKEVFGENGAAVPYSYSFTYDTSLGAQTAFIAAGSDVAHDFYGYSAAGIVASNLTFGNATWTPDGISPLYAAGHTADFWVDTDLTVAAPTLLWAIFESDLGSLRLGNPRYQVSSGLFLTSISTLAKINNFKFTDAIGDMTMETSTMTPVPEPASLLFVSGGLLGLVARARRSKKS